MRLLTAGAALAAALLTGSVPAVALFTADPPGTEEKSERAETQRESAEGPPAHVVEGKPAKTGKHGAHGKPAYAGRQGAHGNPHGPDHGANMKSYAEQHAEAMETWGPCMENLDSGGEQEPSRAEKLDACGSKPTPPGHRAHEHPGHQSWHKFHRRFDADADPGNR